MNLGIYPIIVLLFLCQPPLSADQAEPAHYDALKNVLTKFTRRMTVLEVGRTSVPYTFSLTAGLKAICIALLTEGDASAVVQEVNKQQHHTITILAPARMSISNFETLGRCEHFDVVYVHDRVGLPKKTVLN